MIILKHQIQVLEYKKIVNIQDKFIQDIYEISGMRMIFETFNSFWACYTYLLDFKYHLESVRSATNGLFRK